MITLSLITCIMMGIAGCMAYDLKKVIAFSTSAQMGLILTIIVIDLYSIGVLLIITLGINKALLFMAIGTLILSYRNIQDIRRVKTYNPYTLILNITTTLNMIGFYCTIIYFSKELIIDYLHLFLMGFIQYVLLIGSLFTISYSIRLFLILA